VLDVGDVLPGVVTPEELGFVVVVWPTVLPGVVPAVLPVWVPMLVLLLVVAGPVPELPLPTPAPVEPAV